jgi:hypothetical protein
MSQELAEAGFHLIESAREALRRAGKPSTVSAVARAVGAVVDQVGLAHRKEGKTGYGLLVRWAAALRDAGICDAVLVVDANGPRFDVTFPDGSKAAPPPGVAEPAEERAARLEAAIRKHRAAQGQDLCWENDIELWEALGDHEKVDRKVPPWPEFMAGCVRYRQMLDRPPKE